MTLNELRYLSCLFFLLRRMACHVCIMSIIYLENIERGGKDIHLPRRLEGSRCLVKRKYRVLPDVPAHAPPSNRITRPRLHMPSELQFQTWRRATGPACTHPQIAGKTFCQGLGVYVTISSRDLGGDIKLGRPRTTYLDEFDMYISPGLRHRRGELISTLSHHSSTSLGENNSS
jgi:hypothetical protein